MKRFRAVFQKVSNPLDQYEQTFIDETWEDALRRCLLGLGEYELRLLMIEPGK